MMWVAEVTWRWVFGAAALVLGAIAVIEVLDAVEVARGDELLLRTWAPMLMAEVLARILRDAGLHLLRAAAVLVPALAGLWTVTAAAGRAATLQVLLAPAEGGRATPPTSNRGWRSLLGVSFLRTALGLAAFVGYVGASVIAGQAAMTSEGEIQPGIFFLVFFPLVLLVVLLWAVLNWFLSVAPLFVVAEGRGTLGSFAESVRFYRRQSRQLWSVTSLYGTLRLMAILAALVVSIGVAEALQKHGAAMIAALVVITLAYFLAADYFYIARLAAYADILQRERERAAQISAAVTAQPQNDAPAGQMSPQA